MGFDQDVEQAADSLVKKFYWATRYVDIDDLRQEARISAWKTLTDHPGKINYAVHRGKSAIIDLIRKEGPLRRDGTFRPQMVPIDRSVEEGYGSRSGGTMKSSLTKKIQRATSVEDPETVEDNFQAMVSVLSPRLQQVAKLMFVYDYSQREIADIMGVTESRVSQLLEKIRHQIKRRYYNGNFPQAD